MTRSRPNTFQALLVYSLLQAAVSLIHINARYDFFVFLTSDGLVRLGECFLSRGDHVVFKKYWGISLASLAAGVFLVGILFVKKPARLVSSPPITLRQASLRGEFLHRASLQPAYLPLALSQSECSRSVSSRSVSSQLGYSLSVYMESAFSS